MYKEYLDFAVEMAKEVGEVHLSYFRKGNLMADTKSNIYDVVTRADKESEELIVKRVLERYPEHKVLGEEGGFRGNEAAAYVWVVDPLDGTNNYSQGLPVFCVSIGLQLDGETIVGVVYAPCLKELYYATKGGGAFMVGAGGEAERIGVSEKQHLDTSVLATGFPYDKDKNPDNNSDNLSRIIPHIRGIRRMGAAAYDLCCVAAGWLDGYWELALQPWDVCAGNLIVEEAGGEIKYFREKRGISEMAGNKAIICEIEKYIR
ncbi:MAG: inositol monophosphatase family protein [Bacteroidales bacterium]